MYLNTIKKILSPLNIIFSVDGNGIIKVKFFSKCVWVMFSQSAIHILMIPWLEIYQFAEIAMCVNGSYCHSENL